MLLTPLSSDASPYTRTPSGNTITPSSSAELDTYREPSTSPFVDKPHVNDICLSASIAVETNEDEVPLPKRLKLEGGRSQEERRAKLQSPQFHSESLLPRGDQFHPQPASPLTDLHRRYWGNPLDPTITTLPTHATDLDGLELGDEEGPSSDVLPGNPFLDVLDRRFLVRAEYIRAFDRAKAVYDKSRYNHLAVVTGQPGIGATPSAVRSARLIISLCVQEKPFGFVMHCDVVLEKSSPSSGTSLDISIYSRTQWKSLILCVFCILTIRGASWIQQMPIYYPP